MKVFQCFVFVSLLIFVQAQFKLCSKNDDATKIDSFATAIVSLLEKLMEGRAQIVDLLFNDELECQQEYIFEKAMEKNHGKFAVRKVQWIIVDTNYSAYHPVLGTKSCEKLPRFIKPYSQPYVLYCPNLNSEQLRTHVYIYEEQRFAGRNVKFLVKGANNFIDLMSIVYFTTNQSSCRKPQLVKTNQFMINESRWLSTEFQNEPTRNFHGCELRVGLNHYPPYNNYIEHDDGSLEAGGNH